MKKKKSKVDIEFLRELGEKFSKEQKKNSTKWEQSFYSKLDSLGISFLFQHPIICKDKLFILDFYIPSIKVVFELDGKWHYEKGQIKRDSRRTSLLRKEGITVIRIANKVEQSLTSKDIQNLLKPWIKF